MAYFRSVIFVEAPDFTRQVTELLEDEDYARLQAYLAQHPGVGDVMEGTGGLRKVRVAMAARGKSAGARVIYYHFVPQSHIAMLMIFARNEREDLAPEHRKALRKIVETWKRHYEQVL